MKKILASILALSLLAPVAAFADYEDMIERQIYMDPSYQANVQKAVKILQDRGYRIKDIEPGVHRGQKILDVEAYKDFQEYDVYLSYPDLKIISERIDW